jgi:hypothetical protein
MNKISPSHLAASPTLEFVNNPLAPDLFSEGAAGILLLNGNVHITLTSTRPDHSPADHARPAHRVVVGRLILPVQGAQALAAALYDFLKQRGFDPVPTPSDPMAVQ